MVSQKIVLSVILCLAVVGFLIFFSLNNKVNLDSNDNVANSISSRKAKTGDWVSVNYTGRFENGTIFDSNINPADPFKFNLGAGQVITGWDEGIVGMKVGQKKTLRIPPEHAYGAMGRPPVIPPNATLIFDVELLAIN